MVEGFCEFAVNGRSFASTIFEPRAPEPNELVVATMNRRYFVGQQPVDVEYTAVHGAKGGPHTRGFQGEQGKIYHSADTVIGYVVKKKLPKGNPCLLFGQLVCDGLTANAQLLADWSGVGLLGSPDTACAAYVSEFFHSDNWRSQCNIDIGPPGAWLTAIHWGMAQYMNCRLQREVPRELWEHRLQAVNGIRRHTVACVVENIPRGMPDLYIAYTPSEADIIGYVSGDSDDRNPHLEYPRNLYYCSDPEIDKNWVYVQKYGDGVDPYDKLNKSSGPIYPTLRDPTGQRICTCAWAKYIDMAQSIKSTDGGYTPNRSHPSEMPKLRNGTWLFNSLACGGSGLREKYKEYLQDNPTRKLSDDVGASNMHVTTWSHPV